MPHSHLRIRTGARRFTAAMTGLALAVLGLVAAVAPARAAGGVPRPDHVVIVIFENTTASTIYGNSQAPYFNHLAATGAEFTNAHAIEHPSEPNYLDLFSGSNQGVTDDSCPHTFSTDNEAAQLINAGLTFTGYAEDLPSAGSTVCTSGNYARKHNPWVNFTNVPAADNQPFSAFPTDFTQLPTLSWVVPNLCDDIHDCSVSTGDTWLKNNLDAYVQWANAHNSLLITTFDENDGASGNNIATIFNGQMVKQGSYGENIDHFSVLRTIEDMYGLPYAGSASSATSISDVWNAGGAETVSVSNPGNQASTQNTAISPVQIQGTDSAGKTLTYSATGLPSGLSISGSGQITGTPTGTGTSTVTVTASSGTASGSTSFTWTVNAQSGGGGIVNGGFETGDLSGWTTTGTASAVNTGAHSGTYAARLGATTATNGDSTAAQTFTAPSGSTQLSFWYNVTCPDTVQYDWATATLADTTAGTTTTALAKTCTPSSGWTQVSAPVTAGHSYTLTLASHDDNYAGDPTYTLFDDVAFSSSAPPPPNPISNGGFETGNLSGWTTTGTTSAVSGGAHSGTYAARLGATTATNGDSTAAQTFTAADGGTLSLWYDLTCPDTVQYDWATVTVKDNTANTTATLLPKTCVANSGWTKLTSAVTANHSYTLTLVSHDDNYSGDPTSTMYDDVSVG